ncbi:MAG: hypothetical protein JOS17DRAFT_825170 [Linnemannia elongata]|nr:MAG: hypothetical protein JOS17DRAFT_825170 [Linnemannia elongata]
MNQTLIMLDILARKEIEQQGFDVSATVGSTGSRISLAFPALTENDILKLLVLDYNRIGEEGMVTLAQPLKSNHKLGMLSRDGNDAYTYKGLKAVEKALPAFAMAPTSSALSIHRAMSGHLSRSMAPSGPVTYRGTIEEAQAAAYKTKPFVDAETVKALKGKKQVKSIQFMNMDRKDRSVTADHVDQVVIVAKQYSELKSTRHSSALSAITSLSGSLCTFIVKVSAVALSQKIEEEEKVVKSAKGDVDALFVGVEDSVKDEHGNIKAKIEDKTLSLPLMIHCFPSRRSLSGGLFWETTTTTVLSCPYNSTAAIFLPSRLLFRNLISVYRPANMGNHNEERVYVALGWLLFSLV